MGNRNNPEYDTFLKGMVRAFQEVQQAKVELFEEDLFKEDE
jgi:hypothetical protein